LISWRSGFNGAADLHPRKRIDVRQTRSPQRCFNGAADLHPRKPLPFEDAAACPYASMGPRIFIRGNGSFVGEAPVDQRLQWGRGSSSAETHQVPPLCRGTRSVLQWGRGSSSAETRAGGVPAWPDRDASMGPRIFIRGNRCALAGDAARVDASMGPRIFIRGNSARCFVVRKNSMLQWGRGSSSAETTASQWTRSRSTRCFNGAADLHPRKRHLRPKGTPM